MPAISSLDLDRDPRSIVGTREFDAPRALVFSAWTDAKHLAQWWGPNGFTTTTYTFDFRPGGIWRFVMHGPDGRDYQNLITFEEIVPPERIVYRLAEPMTSSRCSFGRRSFSRISAAARASFGAATSHRPRNAIASSRNMAPTRA